MSTLTKKVWYTQFWPWFLILLPMAAVVAGISTVIIATNNKPEMVIDDYYKTGKAINADLSLLNKAQELGISANVTQQDDLILIKITGMKNNASIQFSLFHATQSKRDKNLTLTADANGLYRYQTDKSLTGKWSLRIEPFDQQWRLQKTVYLPASNITL